MGKAGRSRRTLWYDPMTLSVRCLGSGSSGNALLVEAGATAVVVDCGIGARALASGLRAAGLATTNVAAVLLTHEHADHVRALPQVLKAGVHLVATAGTARAADLPVGRTEIVYAGRSVAVDAIEVTPLPVSHDAAEPCGFHLRADGIAVTVVTDLGRGDAALHDHLAEADLIVLEANHDEAMLRAGPYPTHLKRRVLSPSGHLSNADCGALLAAALRGAKAPPTIWLAHLSSTNNLPALAQQTVQRSLASHGLTPAVVPLPRNGHDRVWQPGRDPGGAVQLAMPLA